MILNGDCLDLMSDLPQVDMVLCDLPYGTTQCSWDTPLDLERLWALYRKICKGPIVLFAKSPFDKVLAVSNLKALRYEWIWEKSKATGFLNAKKRPLEAHESILVFSDRTPPYYPQMTPGEPYDKGVRKKQTEDDIYGQFNQTHIKSSGQRYPRSVVYFKTAESEGKTFHKTQKPVDLCRYLIRTYTQPGQVILDNCMGSGTTGIAARLEDREFIGIEKDEAMFNIAKERLNG